MGSYLSIQSLVFQPPKPNKSMKKKLQSTTSINGNVIYFRYFKNTTSNTYIIWSHGNAMLCYYMDDYLLKLSQQLQVNVICYDYQGYGFSEGECSEQNCYDDLGAVINYVKNICLNAKIILVGQSLGTGVVIDYVSKCYWNEPILLISPYKSMIRVISDNFASSIGYGMSFMDMFNSYGKIQNVMCPVKIIHGMDDDVISVVHGMELYELVKNKCKPVWINDASHNDIFEYIDISIYSDLMK